MSSTSKRPIGYYWVKFREFGEWSPAYYRGEELWPWNVIGSESEYDGGGFYAIGEPVAPPSVQATNSIASQIEGGGYGRQY